MRQIVDRLETNARDVNATFQQFSLAISMEIAITTNMRQSREYRTTVSRQLHEPFANLYPNLRRDRVHVAHYVRATVVRDSRDTRAKLAR